MRRRLLTALSLTMLAAAPFNGSAAEVEVIYGDDDRRDVYDQQNDPLHVELARSTAILTYKTNVTVDPNNPDIATLPDAKFGTSFNLCSDERFKDQPNPGFCSGFLVGEDTFVTAGHCINESRCSQTAFVFDFGYDSPNKEVTTVETKNVYYCKTIVAHDLAGSRGTDYAVIQLDRKVTDRNPVKFRKQGTVGNGDPLVVIGHPSGLPTKIAGGAAVRDNAAASYFTANLDTYGGNSGSAVFNASTGVVEGILVRGETDFVSRSNPAGGTCRASNKCADDGCRGEDVTKATEFAPYVKDPDAPTRPTRDMSDVVEPAADIPDNDTTGLEVEFDVTEEAELAEIGVHVKIDHTYVGDLEIELHHPDGSTVTLQSRSGGGADNLDQVFGLNGRAVRDLNQLQGKSTKGTWKVVVKDLANRDTGVLNYVGLTLRVFTGS